MVNLDCKIEELTNIFRKNSRYESHKLVKPILIEMAKNKSYLEEVIRRCVCQESFFEQKRINPAIAFKIFENKDFSFVAHAFMPLPERNTDITHQSIHHHGNLLLSTVNCFGNGYESILFKKGFKILDNNAILEVDKQYVNSYLNYEFVDSRTPHVVYYPKEITITYALWSTEKQNASDSIKKFQILKRYKNQLKSLVQTFRAEKLFNLNKVEFMDFYIENGKVIPMKERVRYPEASNQNFINNFFYLLQEIGLEKSDFLIEQVKKLEEPIQSKVKLYLAKYLDKKNIKDSLETSQLNIPKVNLNRLDLEMIFTRR